MKSKKTLVLGASPNSIRFSHKAVKSLIYHQHEVIPVGRRNGTIAGREILTGKPGIDHLHTVSLYMGPSGQAEYYDYIISLKPKRVIFNPGTVNPEFMAMLSSKGIEPVEDCMLIMLNQGTY